MSCYKQHSFGSRFSYAVSSPLWVESAPSPSLLFVRRTLCYTCYAAGMQAQWLNAEATINDLSPCNAGTCLSKSQHSKCVIEDKR